MVMLFGVASVITAFIGLCLLFFQATRKTYPGFGYWTAGVGFLALGYLLHALRGQVPLWSTVLLGNCAFPLGMVLHLDGIRRFLGLNPASRLWYALPVLVFAGFGLFYFQWDSPTWRGLVLAIPLTAIHWTMAALIFRRGLQPPSVFYKTIGLLLSFAGLLIFVRFVWLLSSPNSELLFKAPMEVGFFIAFIVLHLGENLLLIMLNAERVESELRGKTHELGERMKELNCLYSISELVEKHIVSLDESLRGIVNLIPPAWQYTEVTCARIILDDREFTTQNYGQPVSKQSADITGHGQITGAVEVGYLEERPEIDEGPFTREERLLLNAIAERVGRVVERMGTQEALRKEKEFTETALDSQRDTFFVFEPATGRAIRWNQAFRDITGYTDEEIATVPAPDSYYGPEDLERARICIQEILETGRCAIELELICKDGQKIPTEYDASLVKDVAGAPKYVIAVGRDIRERKKAEEELQDKQRLLEGILDSSPVGIAYGRDRRILWANRAWERIFGFEHPDEYVGKSIRGHYASDQEYERIGTELYSATQRGVITETDAVLRRNDGSFVQGHLSAKVMETSETNMRDVIVAVSDISDRKKAERDRERLIAQLEQALAEVKRLSGFLPICASCKKIRDDKGYWQQVEEYIRDHSEAEFSHSICPDCARKLYPGLYVDK